MLNAVVFAVALEFLAELCSSISPDTDRKAVFHEPFVHHRCNDLCLKVMKLMFPQVA